MKEDRLNELKAFIDEYGEKLNLYSILQINTNSVIVFKVNSDLSLQESESLRQMAKERVEKVLNCKAIILCNEIDILGVFEKKDNNA